MNKKHKIKFPYLMNQFSVTKICKKVPQLITKTAVLKFVKKN